MEIKEELDIDAVVIKTEIDDDQFQYSEQVCQRPLEELEVGREFKTEQIILPRKKRMVNHCPKCGKKYTVRTSFLRHLVICGQPEEFKRAMMRFSCDHCQFKTNYKHTLADHILAKHLPWDPDRNKCKKCEKSFSNPSHLGRHLKICGQTREYKRSIMKFSCELCPFRSVEKASLDDHVQVKHLPHNPNFNKCDKCGKTYSHRCYLKIHLKKCGLSSEEKHLMLPYSCDHCHYRTNYKTRLVDHIQAKHIMLNPNSNKCSKCGKNYVWSSDLYMHSKLCGQTELYKRAMMKFSCAHCKFKTNHKLHLSDHIHAKHFPRNRKFSICDICGKSFTRPAGLKVHRKACGKSKDFKRSLLPLGCDHCKYRTNRKTYLIKHILVKHLPKSKNLNKCSKCGKKLPVWTTEKKHSEVCVPKKKYRPPIAFVVC